MKLDQLETPCLVLDKAKLERNIARMHAHLDQLGAQLRILPNHARATGAQHQTYHLVRGDADEISAIWPRIGGW